LLFDKTIIGIELLLAPDKTSLHIDFQATFDNSVYRFYIRLQTES